MVGKGGCEHNVVGRRCVSGSRDHLNGRAEAGGVHFVVLWDLQERRVENNSPDMSVEPVSLLGNALECRCMRIRDREHRAPRRELHGTGGKSGILLTAQRR